MYYKGSIERKAEWANREGKGREIEIRVQARLHAAEKRCSTASKVGQARYGAWVSFVQTCSSRRKSLQKASAVQSI